MQSKNLKREMHTSNIQQRFFPSVAESKAAIKTQCWFCVHRQANICYSHRLKSVEESFVLSGEEKIIGLGIFLYCEVLLLH